MKCSAPTRKSVELTITCCNNKSRVRGNSGLPLKLKCFKDGQDKSKHKWTVRKDGTPPSNDSSACTIDDLASELAGRSVARKSLLGTWKELRSGLSKLPSPPPATPMETDTQRDSEHLPCGQTPTTTSVPERRPGTSLHRPLNSTPPRNCHPGNAVGLFRKELFLLFFLRLLLVVPRSEVAS
ncbi:hypothetical protein RvY_05939-2 [Ramazzottius varieornatus]|uniref:Uncharacterized protein n=1 Tax=Ramazzottius varieornatus TaxID=947166 RepID=A0A1D1UWS7_RAMVA|nr:hypothetical protein RvY_05939-2 [Ramazzottius varieornatus]